jgi:peptidoglycan L-alanyl-D-glutamate endopeptidase CwlK
VPKLDPSLDSRNPTLLTPEFLTRLSLFQTLVNAMGYEYAHSSGLRGPVAQAKLWCGSRCVQEIMEAKARLLRAGAPRMANLLREEYACSHPPRTNHLPGQSWHQWGEAMDYCLIVPGVGAAWKGTPYSLMKKVAKEAGITSSMGWSIAKDSNHVQLQESYTPLVAKFNMSWTDVDRRMWEVYDL